MAFDFLNSGANYLNRTPAVLPYLDAQPCSLAVWAKQDTNILCSIFSNNWNNGNPRLYIDLTVSGANTIQRLYSGNYSNSTANAFSTAWVHYGWTWDVDDAIAFFRDGAANGTASRAVGGAASPPNACCIGTLNSAGSFKFDGSMAEFAIWSAVLTVAEFAAMAKGVSPWLIRPDSLVSYVPMSRRSPENLDPVLGNWTKAGTLTWVEHPRIIQPTRARIYSIAAAVGGVTVPPLYMHRTTQGMS